jgi:type IV secretion system protein VirB10
MTHPSNPIKLPKGVGISPKSFIVATVGFVLILVFVMVMIFTYRGKKTDDKPKEQNTLVQQQSGLSPEDAIRKINETLGEGILVKPKTAQSTQSTPTDSPSINANTPAITAENATQNSVDVQAARSNISVVNNFQGASPPPINNNPNNMNLAGFNPSLIGNNPTDPNQPGPGGNNYAVQNNQGGKTAFLESMQKKGDKFYLDSRLTKPISPYEVKAGTIIPATLQTGIDSDLPGVIFASVSQNVYDTVTGNYLLIPQGTKLMGFYDSQVTYGQQRVLIAWSRLTFPNGDSFDLEGMPGADLMGMAGLHDLVDNHYIRIFGSALAFSLFGAAGQLSQPQQQTNGVLTNEQIIYGAIGQQLTQTGAQLTEKNINIQPTLTIRPGTKFNVLITRDMVLPSAYRF